MPVRNHGEFVAEMLDSVLGQTHERLELVMVECGSSDGTAEIVAEYQRRDPARVRPVYLDHDPGFRRARHLAFSRTRGELLCWMDSDDVWMPHKLERQIELLRERSDLGLVYSYFDVFDSATGAVLDWEVSRCDLEGDVLAELFTVGCFIASQTTMFRREAVEKQLRIASRGDVAFLDDYELWMQIALDWHLARVPEVLMRYRRHDRNLSTRLTESRSPLEIQLRMQRQLLKREPRARAALGDIRFQARAEFLRGVAHAERGSLRRTSLLARSRACRLAAALARPPRTREFRIAAPSASPLPA